MAILGLDSITGLQTARLLADRGVPVVGAARNRRHFACRSWRVDEVLEAVPEALPSVLQHFHSRLGEPFVAIPCSDSWVAELAASRPVWPTTVRAVMPDPELVSRLMDKVQFAEFTRENGIVTPHTVVISDRRRVADLMSSVTFPAVVKPNRKPPGWDGWMGGKVAVVHDPAELRRAVERGLQRAESLIVQEWVGGGEEALISFNGYFDRHSQPLASFVARKLRQWPPGAGTSASGEEIRDDEVAKLSVELFQKAGFRGLAYLEVKRRDGDGAPIVIEANVGRPTGRSAICEAGGVELVYSAYRDALGLSPLPANEQAFRGVKWVYLRHEVQAAAHAVRRRRLTLGEWWGSLRGPKVYAVWSWRDPLPFLADVVATVAKVALRLLGRPAKRHTEG